MNKEEYKGLLKSPQWKKKRLCILKRDGHSCVKCKSTTSLHVHHKHYIQGKLPWEVPDNFLITLCATCHLKEHEGRLISSFIIKSKAPKSKPKKKYTTKKKGVKKVKQPLYKKSAKQLRREEERKRIAEDLRKRQTNIKYDFSKPIWQE